MAMTRDRGIPNRRIPKPSQPQPRRKAANSSSQNLDRSHKASTRQTSSSETDSSKQTLDRDSPPDTPPEATWKRLRNWKTAVILGLVMTTGLTAFSIGFLFKLPAVPNCPAIFWPLASASLRMHCAQLAANKQTVNDLLEAIKLVNSLPPDHPLHDEVNRLVEQWAEDILGLADEAFHAGKLKEAIDVARKIPNNTSAHDQIEKRIEKWQGIWAEAETIYGRVEDALRKQNWRKASSEAARLLSIDNNFWQTTKYQELTTIITATRQDISKLAKAKDLIDRGGVTNLLEAVKLISSIDEKSYVYQEAQETVAKVGQEMMDLAQSRLDRKDLSGALDIISKIPPNTKLQREIEDFDVIARAQSKAWGGTAADIEAAIAQAQDLQLGRPYYDKAQKLIARWQLEKSDVAQLERARQLAQSGRSDDLAEAIAQASLVPSDNPRSKEAQQLVSQVSSQMQEMQDRPILDQATQMASAGDVNGLQSAIDEARRITSGRSLYDEAQGKIGQWRSQIARLQDQPILDQADTLADAGDLLSAIAAAQQVNSGSALYDNAQAKVQNWQNRIQAQSNLQAARDAANGGTPDALSQAIRLADGVPGTTSLRTEANQAITQWSQQILQAAIVQADTDVLGAIATAQKIPPRTEAYAAAQLQIQAWRKAIGR
ncbi:hypothetical protein ACKFKF_01755 [Phormidesmis sp. 146-12]